MNFSPTEELRFYSDIKEHSCVYRYEFTCAEKFDESVLAQAIEQSIRFFPKFQRRPYIRKDGKGVILLENPLPVPIFHDDLPRALGTDETNGYLFRINCRDNDLSISFFHSLGDGKASFRFALHVLYYYMKLRGYAVTPGRFILTEEDMKAPDLLKSLEEFVAEMDIPDEEAETPPYEEDRTFTLEKDFALYNQPGFHAMTLSAPIEGLLNVVHENDTSPLCLIVVLLAHAVKDVYQAEGKVIQFSTAVEMRTRFKSSSQREFSTYANLYYLPEWDELPLSEVCAKIRGEIENELRLPRVKSTVLETASADDLFRQYFDLRKPERIKDVFRKKDQQPVKGCAYLSSTGIIRMPEEINDFITAFRVRCTPTSRVPNMFLYTLRDRFYVQISDNDVDGQMEQSFCNILQQHGIPCTLDDFGVVQVDYLGDISIEPGDN